MSFRNIGYKSIDAKVVPDWALQSKREPVMDRGAVAYGWIIEGGFWDNPDNDYR